MIDVKAKKDKIVASLEAGGPSIPVRISRVIEMEPIFTSAILSELHNEGRIKMSHMRVGSSQLYFLPGQEQRLEEHIENLKLVEKQAFDKIKKEKVINEENEEPAIRVALSNLRDFAKSFEHEGKRMWRYAFASEEEVGEILNPRKKREERREEEIKKDERKKEEKDEGGDDVERVDGFVVNEKEVDVKGEKKIEPIFESVNTEFLDEVRVFLKKKGIAIDEEIQVDKKEVIARISFESRVGVLNFLLIAKNKKSVSKDELGIVMQRTNYHKMPCLLVTRKEVSKSLQNLIKENGLIVLDSLE
jgi:hypothetical protein